MGTETEIIAWITGAVTIDNVKTALTPTKTDNAALNAFLRILNVVSVNVGKNKNADDG